MTRGHPLDLPPALRPGRALRDWAATAFEGRTPGPPSTRVAAHTTAAIAVRAAFFCTAAAVLPDAWAQRVPDAGSLLQQEPRAAPAPAQRLERPQAPAPEAPALRDGSGVRVVLRLVRFSGAQGLVESTQLQAQVRDALGRSLSFGELQALAERITRLLKSRGWLLAEAYLPQQDLSDGVLEIALRSGRLEQDDGAAAVSVVREPGVRLDESRARWTMAAAVAAADGSAPRAEHIERGVLLLNDLPGVSAKSFLERGSQPGTTRVGVQVAQGPAFGGSAWADNYGSRFTGAGRTNVQLALNDPAGRGDQATLLATKAAGLQTARAGYSLPQGYTGLRLSANASGLEYKVGKEQAAQRSEGSARSVGLGLSAPIVRSRDSNLSVSASYDQKSLTDRTAGTTTRDKKVRVMVLGLTADRHDEGGLFNALLGFTGGHLNLDGVPADAAADSQTARSAGTFNKLTASLARLQRLTDQTSAFGAVNAQWARQNLDSSEKFFLGGPSAIRAYPTGEGSGDQGWMINAEIRHELPALRTSGLGDLQAIVFADHGAVRLQAAPWAAATNATGRNHYALSGVGLGLNLSKSGQYSVRTAWGRVIGDNPGRSLVNGADSDGRRNRQRVWLLAQINF